MYASAWPLHVKWLVWVWSLAIAVSCHFLDSKLLPSLQSDCLEISMRPLWPTTRLDIKKSLITGISTWWQEYDRYQVHTLSPSLFRDIPLTAFLCFRKFQLHFICISSLNWPQFYSIFAFCCLISLPLSDSFLSLHFHATLSPAHS